jgi:hypothetical protein
MNTFAFDFETFLIQPGKHVPKAVLFSWARGFEVGEYGVAHMNPRIDSGVFENRDEAKERLRLALEADIVVGANVAYDLAVAGQEWPDLWELIWKAYRDGRVWDVEITEKLIAVGNGELKWRFVRAPDGSIATETREYNLERLALERVRIQLDKNTWRLVYGTLYDKQMHEFPEGALVYSLLDAISTLAVFASQMREDRRYLVDGSRQARAAWWIHLMSVRGFALDVRAVQALEKHLLDERSSRQALLVSYGIVRPNGSRDTNAAAARMVEVCKSKGITPKKTDGGEGTALDEEACLESGDPVLIAYAEYTSLTSTLTKDVALLKEAALAGMPIQSRFDVLKETGRTGSSGGKVKKKADRVNRTAFAFQLQNVKRDPKPRPDGSYPPTTRGCFVPRPGYVLCSIDYGQMELHAWAQVCTTLLGHSELARLLNGGVDVHCKLGAMAISRTYEEVYANRKKEPWAKDARQMAKAGNFGFPGGLGAKAFKAYAKASWGVLLTDAEAIRLYALWKDMLPEADEYFAFVKRLVDEGGNREIIQVGSDRVRGDVGFTDGANGFFQGLAADCAKDAGFFLSEACYLDKSSALYGSYIVNFVHDEFLFELLEARAHEAAFEAVRIMKAAGRRWMPDCPPGCEPALMERWYKDAEPVYDENGRLSVWRPKKLGPMEGFA